MTTLAEIETEWSKDCKINYEELGQESAKIPELHAKYLKLFNKEALLFEQAKNEARKIQLRLRELYLGTLSQEDCVRLGWEMQYKKILKTEVESYVQADENYIKSTKIMHRQQVKVEGLESVLKQINNRSFQITNAINYERMRHGY